VGPSATCGRVQSSLPQKAEGKPARMNEFLEFTLSVPVVSICRTIEGIPYAALINDEETPAFIGVRK